MKKKRLLLKYIFLVYACFLFGNAFCQTEWITEIPVLGRAYSMLRTKDSCYAVLKVPLYYNEDSTDYIYELQLSKVSPQGELLWYKTIFSDTLDFSYLSFIQLSNEDFFITGKCYWCPFYAIASKDGELKYFNRLAYYLDIPNSYSYYCSPIEFSTNEIWVLGGFIDKFITKIDILHNTISVDSSLLGIQNSLIMQKLTDSTLLLFSGHPLEVYEIDTNLNLLNHSTFNFNLFNLVANPCNSMRFNPFDNNYYFYVNTLDPYPNEHYGFLLINQRLDSVGFIDNFDFYPNQSQVEYPRVLDFDFPKPGTISMTGFIWWYPGIAIELPYIQVYNYLEDSVEYYHAYVGSVTKYSINLFREGNGYVMLHMFPGYPEFVFVLKENTGTGNKITNIDYDGGINIYPNPAKDHIKISSTDYAFNEIIIFDPDGRMIRQIKLNETFNADIAISDLIPGKYILEIINKNTSFVKPFIKL